MALEGALTGVNSTWNPPPAICRDFEQGMDSAEGNVAHRRLRDCGFDLEEALASASQARDATTRGSLAARSRAEQYGPVPVPADVDARRLAHLTLRYARNFIETGQRRRLYLVWSGMPMFRACTWTAASWHYPNRSPCSGQIRAVIPMSERAVNVELAGMFNFLVQFG